MPLESNVTSFVHTWKDISGICRSSQALLMSSPSLKRVPLVSQEKSQVALSSVIFSDGHQNGSDDGTAEDPGKILPGMYTSMADKEVEVHYTPGNPH